MSNTNYNKINWWLFFGILLIGANLRAPITSVGVALPNIKESLTLSNTTVSVVTIIPLIAFAIVSLFVAKTSNRFGMEKTLFYALILILIGVILRSITNIPTLFIGTVLIGIGIAFGNVLAPGVIKMKFPYRIGIMMGYYTVVMNIFGSLSSYVTGPLVDRYNYSIALGSIGLVTLVAIIIWSFQLRIPQDEINKSAQGSINVWKSLLAWQITLLMGGQSLLFYSLVNWLPEYLLTYDISINQAGLYLSLLQLAIIPLTFVTPIVIEKMHSQIMVTIFTGFLFTIGIVLMMWFPKYSLLSVIIIGIASGIAFGLVNTFFILRTENSFTAAKLSGMAQSVGYLFAAIGPLLFGILHDLTGTWTLSLSILLITSLLIMIIGAGAGRNKTIEQSLTK